MDKEIIAAVRRKAIGYTTEECVEEMVERDGEMQTVKRRVTVKEVPPDISAVKCLIDMGEELALEDMTAAELEKEKRRLLKLLKESENEACKNK